MSAKSTRSTKSVRSVRSAKPIPPMNCLVTGASGYIALHVVDLLLREGHKVKASVRSLENAEKNAPIKKLALRPEQLELVEADLLKADSWKEAMKGVDVVFHVASPFPLGDCEEDAVVKPALDGTLNVLRACAEGNVRKVVLTSSGYAVFGDEEGNKTYTEEDWADPEKTKPYGKSKILAEKAAWDFVEEKKKANEQIFELSVINPTFVMGPVLSNQLGTSGKVFLMNFNSGDAPPASPDMKMPCCDVRDVALAHYRAATLPEAVGKRHIVISTPEYIPLSSFRKILSKEFNPKGMNIKELSVLSDQPPTHETTKLDNSRMINVLKVQPTDFSITLIDMANSMIELGLAKLE